MGKVIKMPDAEYRMWVNVNQKALNEMLNNKKIDVYWMSKGKNAEYVKRYLSEHGYTLT